MAQEITETQVKDAVIKKLMALSSEGKDILGGVFIAHNGAVTLDVTIHSESEYGVCYACYNRMWNWIVPKADITPSL